MIAPAKQIWPAGRVALASGVLILMTTGIEEETERGNLRAESVCVNGTFCQERERGGER